LYAEVRFDKEGRAVLSLPTVSLEEMEHTCSIDVAAQGGAEQSSVAALLQLTQARISQLETRSLATLRKHFLARET
jgi:DNA-directed RNA polymerase specialized sigma subunit